LAAPFKPKDASLMSIVSAFEDAYSAYNTHQGTMERYWTLQYLLQHDIKELDATVIKSFPGELPVVRAVELPLAVSVQSAVALERGAMVRIRIAHIDSMALDVTAHFVSLLDAPSAVEDDGSEQELSAGPLTIAMDLDDAEDTDTPTEGQAPTANN
jgi:exoribonuclease-2